MRSLNWPSSIHCPKFGNTFSSSICEALEVRMKPFGSVDLGCRDVQVTVDQ